MKSLSLILFFIFQNEAFARDFSDFSHTANFTRQLDLILKLNQPTGCEPTPTPKLSEGLSFSDFTRSTQCSELFSTEPPSGFETSTWLPVCSKYLEVTLSKDGKSTKEIATQLDAYAKGLDSCDPTNANGNRFAANYKAPSQKDTGLTLLSAEKLNHVTEVTKKYIEKTAVACCGSDQECANLVKKVELEYCKPQNDLTASDPCISIGSRYVPTQSNHMDFKNPEPGVLHLAPFAQLLSQETIAHELGHACSSILAKLAVKNGNEKVFKDMVNLYQNSNCASTLIAEEIYKDLYTKSGASPETASCIIETSGKGYRQRFQSGMCENGCPRMQLEESYAMLFSMQTLDSPEAAIPALIPRMTCAGQRDSFHPLLADILACALKTPSLLARFEKFTECKK